MSFSKFKSICRVVRILVGLALIVAGVVTGIYWFYLGVLPLLVGVVNVCPLCQITGKCDLPKNTEI
jgi:hypothetical protein